jgi:hypothetical protein
MVEEFTKLPNIFGKNNDISRKIEMEDMPRTSRIKKDNAEAQQRLSRVQREEVEVFVSPQKEISIPQRDINIS